MTAEVNVKSSFPDNIADFDDKEYSELTFTIPSLNPLGLHRNRLAKAYEMIDKLFKGIEYPSIAEFDKSKMCITWKFIKAETNEIYRSSLVKWLRFCYGEDQVFEKKECPSALAVLQQLKLKCEEDKIEKEFEEFFVGETKKSVNSGPLFLLELGGEYEECFDVEKCKVVSTLCDMVLSHENMINNPEVIDECLLKLPIPYLSKAQYSEVPDDVCEFRIRNEYVKCHNSLSDEDKRKVLMDCKQGIMDDEELDMIPKGILEDKDIIELCKRGLKTWKKHWIEGM